MIASVDACKKGWLVAMSDGWPCKESPHLQVHPNFVSILDATAACSIVMVDMPIGLPSGGTPRTCDVEAQVSLGKRGRDRVFEAPPRAALVARTPVEFQRIHRELTGKGAGLPVWGIAPLLREMDAAVSPELQKRVLEFHPELAWKHLAGEVLASKHRGRGLLQRFDVLLREGTTGIFDLQRDPVAETVDLDDILDAVVGLAVADGVWKRPEMKRRLPVGEPPRDEHGLRMEIWF